MALPLPLERRRGLAPTDPSPARRRKFIEGTFGELAASIGAGFLENNGVLLVLFETPSGFAIFCFCGIDLYIPDAIESMWVNFAKYSRAREVVWLKEFQTFDDKFSAINVNTGVNRQLTEMIMKWHRPGQELVVGKPEYKLIVEMSLGIPCLHDENVMELMWGMKRLMHSLVPREKLELPEEDRLLMSRGLQILLSRYGFDDVKPEMVNEQIVVTASVLFNCDAVEKEQYETFLSIGRHLKNVSGIDYENWSLLKLAAAFNIICSREIGDSDEMLSEDVRTKLLDDADKYEDKINKLTFRSAYKKLMSNHQIKARHIDMLAVLVKKASGAAGEVMDG